MNFIVNNRRYPNRKLTNADAAKFKPSNGHALDAHALPPATWLAPRGPCLASFEKCVVPVLETGPLREISGQGARQDATPFRPPRLHWRSNGSAAEIRGFKKKGRTRLAAGSLATRWERCYAASCAKCARFADEKECCSDDVSLLLKGMVHKFVKTANNILTTVSRKILSLD